MYQKSTLFGIVDKTIHWMLEQENNKNIRIRFYWANTQICRSFIEPFIQEIISRKRAFDECMSAHSMYIISYLTQ